MEIWHKVKVNDFDVLKPPIAVETYYKEGNVTKVCLLIPPCSVITLIPSDNTEHFAGPRTMRMRLKRWSLKPHGETNKMFLASYD